MSEYNKRTFVIIEEKFKNSHIEECYINNKYDKTSDIIRQSQQSVSREHVMLMFLRYHIKWYLNENMTLTFHAN